jgi:hypothetical protein
MQPPQREPEQKDRCLMSHEAQLTRLPHSIGEWPASWLAHQSYKLAKGTDQIGLSSILPLSAHLLRRLAALKSNSLAHVTGLASSASAAALICSRSSSVIGICIPAVLRSLGFLGGLPRLFSMRINIYRKNPVSTIAIQNKSVHNKYRQKKTPAAAETTDGATRTGFRQIPAW